MSFSSRRPFTGLVQRARGGGRPQNYGHFDGYRQNDEYPDFRQQHGEPSQRGRNNPGRKAYNKQREEDFRKKKGSIIQDAKREEIKKELFAGLTEEQVNTFSDPQQAKALMLSITTRGIGFGTITLCYAAKMYSERIVVPNVYSQYRAYLGLFEARYFKIQKHCPLLPRFTDEAYDSSSITADFLKVIRTFTFVPTPIKYIIDAIGPFSYEDKQYQPIVKKKRIVEGRFLPRAENVMLSNLRETVVALSDPQTPVRVRRAFKNHNPIPGAQWNGDLLVNADEIMPAVYEFDDHLRSDIMRIIPFLSSLQKHVPKLVGGPLEGKTTGKPACLISNEMEDLRCPDRREGQTLDEYYKECILEGNIREYSSITKLLPAERLEGQIILLGEQPESLNLMRPVYSLRDSTIHSSFMSADYKSVWQVMYGL